MLETIEHAQLSAWRRRSETMIAIAQTSIAAMLSLVYFSASKPSDTLVGFELTFYAMLLFPLFGIVRIAITRHPWALSSAFGWISCVFDILMVSVIIASYTPEYGNHAASLRAPTFSFYFVIIALTAIRFDMRQVLFCGALAAASWAAITVGALLGGAQRTHSYIEYISSDGVLVGAEVERILSLLIFSGVLAVAMSRGKSLLTDALGKTRAEAASRRAQEASKAKSEFLANMSHEIRTPLNGLIGVTELLERTSLDSRQSEYVRILKTSGDALLVVISDILDISKIEAGRLELSRTPFNVRQIVEDVGATYAAKAAAAGVELAVSAPIDDGCWVVGDPDRMRQIVSNLVGNAVRFTDKGHILIRLQIACAPGADQASLTIDVEDTGVGIAEADLARIFEKFEQADNSSTRKYSGTGLGLAISRSLTRAMGGDIRVRSAVGSGSTFTIAVDLPRASAGDDSAKSPLTDGARVLVVDDLPINRKIVADMLAFWGIEAVCCEGAQDALAAFQREPDGFAAILLDYQMPGMDGVALARALRAQTGERTPAMILLTSVDQVAHLSDVESAGISGQTIKPIRAEALRSLLERHAGKMREVAPQTRTAPNAIGDDVTGERPVILIAEDNEVNRLVLLGMLERFNARCIVAENGRAAVDKFQSEARVDVVLMDVSMPVLDGLEATLEIRSIEAAQALPRTPIIGVTAHATPEDRLRCLAAGMSDCITKPIKSAILNAALDPLLTYRGPSGGDGRQARAHAG